MKTQNTSLSQKDNIYIAFLDITTHSRFPCDAQAPCLPSNVIKRFFRVWPIDGGAGDCVIGGISQLFPLEPAARIPDLLSGRCSRINAPLKFAEEADSIFSFLFHAQIRVALLSFIFKNIYYGEGQQRKRMSPSRQAGRFFVLRQIFFLWIKM